jgi:hypothetical protein
MEVYRLEVGSSDVHLLLSTILRQHDVDLIIGTDFSTLSNIFTTLINYDYRVIPAGSVVYWNADLTKLHTPSTRILQATKEYLLTQLGSRDKFLVHSLVTNIFEHYKSHYSFLPQNVRIESADAYVDWVNKSLTASDHTIFCLTHGDQPVGLAMIKISGVYADILLAGVIAEATGTGAYGSLLLAIYDYLISEQISMVQISTQGFNIRVQRRWVKLGLRPIYCGQRFHAWSDPTYKKVVGLS